MGIRQREGGEARGLGTLTFVMGFCLHLSDERFKTTMSLIDLACQIREIGMQVNFCAGQFSVATVAAHLQQFHPTALELG